MSVSNIDVSHTAFDLQLDVCGLECPLPLLKTKLCLKSMSVGQTLLVKTSQASSVRDFNLYICSAGHALLNYDANGGIHRFWIQK
jgi:tRNA 2-thiouridine synthesizing protein A